MRRLAVSGGAVGDDQDFVARGAYTTVVFFVAPGENFDLASFSFQAPMLGFWAKLTAAPTMHSASVSTIDLDFLWSPFCEAGNGTDWWGGNLMHAGALSNG